MRIYKQDELKSKIKSGNFAPVYFLFGNEPYLITHYTNLIIKNTVTALEDINLRYYDSEFDVDEIYATAFQVPMMSAMKCLVITKKQLMFAICIVCTLAVAIVGSVGVFANSDRLLPIYCVETDKKQVAISFDAAWDNSKKVQNNIW